VCDAYRGTSQHLGVEYVQCDVHGNIATAPGCTAYSGDDDLARHRVYGNLEGLDVCKEAWALFKRHW
jgi:hypothetical protein